MFDDEYREFKGDSSNQKQSSDNTIPFLGGRPERDLTITEGEIKDLIISLEADTLEQFNARYGMSIA